MTIDSTFHALSLIFQVFLLDLILSGDNAVVIALSCRSLPPRQMKKAVLFGSGAAIGMRVVLTMVVSMLLRVPLLKLIGAGLLIVIAIRLLIEEKRGEHPAGEESPSGLWSAVMTVVVADLVMSLDNVVALAAVTEGSIVFLVLGLLLSVLLLMFSSTLMIDLLRRFPILIPASGALLGYVAGSIAVSDPAVADWVNTQSPALTGLVPLLCAVFVVAESRIIERRRNQLPRSARLETPAKPKESATTAIRVPDAGAAIIPSSAPEIAAAKKERPQRGQEDVGTVTAPQGYPENVPPANYFGLGKLLGNPILQAVTSVLLAIFCIVFLPKKLDIAILIGIIALMLFKIF